MSVYISNVFVLFKQPQSNIFISGHFRETFLSISHSYVKYVNLYGKNITQWAFKIDRQQCEFPKTDRH